MQIALSYPIQYQRLNLHILKSLQIADKMFTWHVNRIQRFDFFIW